MEIFRKHGDNLSAKSFLDGWTIQKWFVFEMDILLAKPKEAQIAHIKKKFSPLSTLRSRFTLMPPGLEGACKPFSALKIPYLKSSSTYNFALSFCKCWPSLNREMWSCKNVWLYDCAMANRNLTPAILLLHLFKTYQLEKHEQIQSFWHWIKKLENLTYFSHLCQVLSFLPFF